MSRMETEEPTQAESEASAWLMLLESSIVPEAEIIRFRTWLAASDADKRAWEDISRTWDHLGPVLAPLARADSAALVAAATAPGAAAERSEGRRLDAPSRFGARGRIAAFGLAAAAVFALLFIPLPRSGGLGESAVHYVTAPAEARTVSLQDGSRVDLSPMAELGVVFDAGARRVELRQGVALFSVAHDPLRPFVVSTPFGEMRALGTQFVVRIGRDGARMSVVEGVVEVLPAPGANLIARMRPGAGPLRAEAQEEVLLSRRGAALQQLDERALSARLAWADAMIAVENEPLRDVAMEVTRFTGAEFIFADQATARTGVSGYFAGDDLPSFLVMLRENFAIENERRADGTIVLRERGRR